MNSSLERSCRSRTIGIYAFFIVGCVIMIFPFVWMLLTSFKSMAESIQIPPTILPAKWLVENYSNALESLPFIRLYINTALLILLRVACAVAFSSAAGYAFAKLKFPG